MFSTTKVMISLLTSLLTFLAIELMEDLLMHRDSTAFRNRFERWKNGELVYENGRVIPGYKTGKGLALDDLKILVGLNVQGWPAYTTELIVAYGDENERRRKALEDVYLNFVTESNDATSVANDRPLNRHLERKAVEGAKAHRAWEEEHPNLTAWGNVLGAVPFAVAAAPAIAAGGSGITTLADAAAATSIGLGITNFLSPLATTSVAGVTLPQLIDSGLTYGFGAHGIQTAIDEGGISPTTALELLPVTRVAKPAFNETAMAIENYRYPLGMPQVPENFLTIKPQVRTKIGDVEIDNPRLYYHQADAGKAKNFISTGRMRTPLEEFWLAKEEAGEKIPLVIRSGIKPGYPQDPGSAMFSQGSLWYGLTPNKPDLLVTAREMPIANKNAFIMSNKASLRKLEEQGTRRVTNDNIYTQGPHNRQNTTAYTWEPGYGYKKVFAEDTPTAEWPMGRTTPQITAKNAANYPSIMADAEDFSLKGVSGLDLFTQRLYNMKIHGQDLRDFSGKTFSSDVKKGISNETKEEIRNNVVARNMREFMNDGLTSSEVAPYATKVELLMDDINVGRYSQGDYEKAGWDGFGGFYDQDRNFISINKEAAEKGLPVEPHEVRHAIDHNIDDEILTPTTELFGKDFDSERVLSSMQRTKQKQNMILQDAYDNDFVDIPNKPGYNEGLEDYSNMEREAITTNRDAREALLGSKKAWDPYLTDKIIDKTPDIAIFNAVERANGYGKRFIRFLRENNKLTPKKAQQFREAMKHVGAVAAPIGLTGYGLFNNQESFGGKIKKRKR